MLKESQVQRKMICMLEACGWYVIKLIQTNKNGITDLEALRGGRAVFIEAKKEGEQPRALQLYRHKELREQGFEVIVADCVNDIKHLLNAN